MKRSLKAILVSLATMAALILPAAAPAHAADVGDGLLACNVNEICFQDAYGTSSGIRHFWYSDMDHSDDYFSTGAPLLDNIGGYWNRDTACNVRMFDVSTTGAWYVYKTLIRGGKGYQDMGRADYSESYNTSARDRNNGHSRC